MTSWPGVAFWRIRFSVLLTWFSCQVQIFQCCSDNFAWQVQHFVWPDLASILRGRRSTLYRWSETNCKTCWHEAVRSALNFPFLMETSQNYFVFSRFKSKNWGSLAELLRFGCCDVQKSKGSRWSALFLVLSSSKIEDVAQKSFAFNLQRDRSIGRQTDR